MFLILKMASIFFVMLCSPISAKKSLKPFSAPKSKITKTLHNNKQPSLTKSEQKTALHLARTTIVDAFKKLPTIRAMPLLSSSLQQKNGAFVTLKKNGKLRGCIGRVTTQEPLYKTIKAMAYAAAFQDHRFKPLRAEELDAITIEITILSKPIPIKSYKEIILGKHGIILKKINPQTRQEVASSVFLPQVAKEQEWNLTTTLEHLSVKAGLNKNAWRNDCQFEVFEGFELHEIEPLP